MTRGLGLSRVSLATLRALRGAIEAESIRCPVTAHGLGAAGFGEISAELVPTLGALDRLGTLAVLEAVIAEREHRPHQHLELVWSGPLAPQATHRDTAVVMRSLFNRAQKSVLVAGYSFYKGKEILEPLHRAMEERDVAVQLFMEIEGYAESSEDGATYARRFIEEFFQENWPRQGERPAVFYDPRTAKRASEDADYASLHAKCVVVDGRWSLVTSANFTNRGQTRNIELGVLIDDPNFAHQVTAQWQALVTNGLLEEGA